MKWGFDLDGTLDHEEIRNLANFLFDHGEEVHVLTGIGTGVNSDHKHAKLTRLGIRCTKMWLCEGETHEDIGYTKALILRRENIPIIVDDSPIYCKQIVAHSVARVLMVVR